MKHERIRERVQRKEPVRSGHFEEELEVSRTFAPPGFSLAASPIAPPDDPESLEERQSAEGQARSNGQATPPPAEGGSPKEIQHPSTAESASSATEDPNMLPETLRLQMEESLEQDFSAVKVVTNSEEAVQNRAEAFAAGDEIHFAPGFYNPETAEGKELIGHELAHVKQQREGRVAATSEINGMPLNEDPDLEKEAVELGALAARADVAGRGKAVQEKMSGLQSAGNVAMRVGQKVIQRNIFGDAWDWGKKAVASAVNFASNVATTVSTVVKNAATMVGNVAKAVGGAAKAVVGTAKSVGGAIMGGVKNLGELLGFALPGNATEALLAIAKAIASTLFMPFKGLIPKAVTNALNMIGKIWDFFDKIADKAQEVIAAIKTWMQARLDTVEAQAKAHLAIYGIPEDHLEGVMTYLQPLLEEVYNKGWSIITEGLWDLVWPIPSVMQNIEAIGTDIKTAGGHLWALEFSKFADVILQINSKLNAILGSLMGWVTVLLVVGGAVLAPFTEGVSAAAGLALAGEIGLALMASMTLNEATIILKSRVSLHPIVEAKADEQKAVENQDYYQKIAVSILTLAILAALFLVIAIAVKIIGVIVRKAVSIFRGLKGEGPKVAEVGKTVGEGAAEKKTTVEEPPKPITEFEKNLPDSIKDNPNFKSLKGAKRSMLLEDLEGNADLLTALDKNPKLLEAWEVLHDTHVDQSMRIKPSALTKVARYMKNGLSIGEDGIVMQADGTQIGKLVPGDVYSRGEFKVEGTYSRRQFDPDMAGGPIERLDWKSAKISEDGIVKIEKHLARFESIEQNELMIARLKKIISNEIEPTDFDKRFFTHELQELQRYENIGVPEGVAPEEVWHNTHAATLEDYQIHETTDPLYDPSVKKPH